MRGARRSAAASNVCYVETAERLMRATYCGSGGAGPSQTAAAPGRPSAAGPGARPCRRVALDTMAFTAHMLARPMSSRNAMATGTAADAQTCATEKLPAPEQRSSQSAERKPRCAHGAKCSWTGCALRRRHERDSIRPATLFCCTASEEQRHRVMCASDSKHDVALQDAGDLRVVTL